MEGEEMSIFSKIANAFKTAAHVISHALVSLVGADLASKFASDAKKILATDFGKLVQSVVDGLMAVAAAQGGAAARQQAFDEIKAQAVASGLDLKDSLINLLIELAVSKAKGVLDVLSTVA
jgi:hypothetical protein